MPASKLVPKQVVLMRYQRQGGMSQEALAKMHGVSQTLVSNVVRGKAYPNAGGPIETERIYRRGR